MKEDINYIIYNNRSRDFVSAFLPKFNIKDFLELEKRYKFLISTYENPWEVLYEDDDIDLNYTDVIYDSADISELKPKVLDNPIANFSDIDYLNNRMIPINVIDKWNISSIIADWSERELEVLGFTLHPVIRNIFKYDSRNGIIIPLIEDGILKNIAIRRIINSPIKYTLAVPDIDVWGLHEIQVGSVIWSTEGLFDMMALSTLVDNVVSVSSATWSTIQIMKLLNKKPSKLNILSDYDFTGLRSASILQRVLSMYGVPCTIFISNKYKDASEHIFEHGLGLDDIEEVSVSKDLLNFIKPDELERNKTYIEYLKERKF